MLKILLSIEWNIKNTQKISSESLARLKYVTHDFPSPFKVLSYSVLGESIATEQMSHHFVAEVEINQLSENHFEFFDRHDLKSLDALRKQLVYQVTAIHLENWFEVTTVDVLFQVTFNYLHHGVENVDFSLVSFQ